MVHASSLWYVDRGRVELRDEIVADGDGPVLVRALHSGISRGTERLVLGGHVPASEFMRMRCPRQAGDFPFPVKYGYALVGRVEDGPAGLAGKNVFLLHPHQSLLRAQVTDVHPLPPGLPPRRAVLAANMETALNVVWDSGLGAGDKVLVVGGGVLGLLIAALAARTPGTTTTVVDIAPERAAPATALGARFALPDDAPDEQDVVIHCSATEAGLACALKCAGVEARVIEASWYGDRKIGAALGESFHARRLQLVSSQVGAVPAARRARWSTTRRLRMALALLQDPAFDCLLTRELAFADAPTALAHIIAGDAGLMTTLRYS